MEELPAIKRSNRSNSVIECYLIINQVSDMFLDV
jgi:hypothetical protein